jgi:hypothetical protein
MGLKSFLEMVWFFPEENFLLMLLVPRDLRALLVQRDPKVQQEQRDLKDQLVQRDPKVQLALRAQRE